MPIKSGNGTQGLGDANGETAETAQAATSPIRIADAAAGGDEETAHESAYMRKARAIQRGKACYHYTKGHEKAGTGRVALDGNDLELARENLRRLRLSIKHGYDSYPCVSARPSKKAQFAALDRDSKADAMSLHGGRLKSAKGADPATWSSSISKVDLDNAADQHVAKKEALQVYNREVRAENKGTIDFKRNLENGEYQIVGTKHKMVDSNLNSTGYAGLYYSAKTRKYKVVHCGRDEAPTLDDSGNERVRDFQKKADADKFLNNLIDLRLPKHAFYSITSYDEVIERFLRQSKEIQAITSVLNRKRMAGDIDDREFDKSYFDQVKQFEWSWLPRNLGFIIALASRLRGPLPKRALGKKGRRHGPTQDWQTDDSNWQILTESIIGSTEIQSDKFGSAESMQKWTIKNLLEPIAQLGGLSGGKSGKFSYPLFLGRYHALQRAFELVETKEPFSRELTIKDKEIDGKLSISALVKECWPEVADEYMHDEGESHKPLTLGELVAFAAFLGDTDFGRLNTFFLGLTTGLRPTELSCLLQAVSSKKNTLKDYYSAGELELDYQNLINKTRISSKPVVSLLASLLLAGPPQTGGLAEFSWRDFHCQHKKSYRKGSGRFALGQHSWLAQFYPKDGSQVSFREVYPRRLRATCSVHLVFCEADRDPRSAYAGRAMAEERLGHKGGTDTLLKHYVRNKPSVALVPLAVFKIFEESDRTVISGKDVLNGQNAWDAFLFKLWYTIVSSKLAHEEREKLNECIFEAHGKLIAKTGWAKAGYSDKYTAAIKVADLFDKWLNITQKIVEDQHTTTEERFAGLRELRRTIAPENTQAIRVLDGLLGVAERRRNLLGETHAEIQFVKADREAMILETRAANDTAINMPADHLRMIAGVEARLETEEHKGEDNEESGEETEEAS